MPHCGRGAMPTSTNLVTPMTTLSMSMRKSLLIVLLPSSNLFWPGHHVRSVPEILCTIQDPSKTSLEDEFNEARCSGGTNEFGFQVYTLDQWRVYDSHFHFSGFLGGISRHTVSAEFLEHQFVEITVDPFLMPSAYVADGSLSPSFFYEALPVFAGCLADNCCVYIPASL